MQILYFTSIYTEFIGASTTRVRGLCRTRVPHRRCQYRLPLRADTVVMGMGLYRSVT